MKSEKWVKNLKKTELLETNMISLNSFLFKKVKYQTVLGEDEDFKRKKSYDHIKTRKFSQ